MEGWVSCRDERWGFSVRHPADWSSTTPPGRCAQLRKGVPSAPHAVPEVDASFRVDALRGSFPAGYLLEGADSSKAHGVSYTDRTELTIAGHPAVRARFHTRGPVPNWGVEYAVRNGDLILAAYISQPSPEVERQFDTVMSTLDW